MDKNIGWWDEYKQPEQQDPVASGSQKDDDEYLKRFDDARKRSGNAYEALLNAMNQKDEIDEKKVAAKRALSGVADALGMLARGYAVSKGALSDPTVKPALGEMEEKLFNLTEKVKERNRGIDSTVAQMNLNRALADQESEYNIYRTGISSRNAQAKLSSDRELALAKLLADQNKSERDRQARIKVAEENAASRIKAAQIRGSAGDKKENESTKHDVSIAGRTYHFGTKAEKEAFLEQARQLGSKRGWDDGKRERKSQIVPNRGDDIGRQVKTLPVDSINTVNELLDALYGTFGSEGGVSSATKATTHKEQTKSQVFKPYTPPWEKKIEEKQTRGGLIARPKEQKPIEAAQSAATSPTPTTNRPKFGNAR